MRKAAQAGDWQRCAALVEKGDPDRFAAAMMGPLAARRVLFPLYAFNLEVARAPWASKEPMIAEMRLQWWRDALEEIGGTGTVRRHEVVDALAGVLDEPAVTQLDALVAARRWDIYTDAFEDAAHFDSYLSATSGGLMATAARLLGAADPEVVDDVGYAAGIANLLRAAPDLEDRGRMPLMDGRPEGLRELAAGALARLDRARANRRAVSTAASSALLTAWAARPVLRQVIEDPARVGAGLLRPGPMRLTRVALLGWWH